MGSSSFWEDLKKGDRKALLTLYRSETSNDIKSFVLKHGGTKENAEDVLVDTILRLIKLIETGKYVEEGRFKAYFYQIGKWVWREEYRRLNRKEIHIVSDIDPNLTVDMTNLELPVNLKDSIEQLSSSAAIQYFLSKNEQCRTIMELRFIKGYSLVEIEKIYKIKHINVRYKRCIEKLKKFLADKATS